MIQHHYNSSNQSKMLIHPFHDTTPRISIKLLFYTRNYHEIQNEGVETSLKAFVAMECMKGMEF